MSVTFHGRSSSHGRKTIPAVRSGYGADTLLDWYRSAYRFWLVHAQCTALAAVIAAEEHGYQINMDYFNAQKERQRDYWVILFHRKILMTSCGVCMMQGWTHVIWYLSRKCSVIFLHCFWVAIPFIWGLLAIVVQFSWYSFMQVFQHYSKTLEHQCCSFLSPVSTPAYGYLPKYSLVWLKHIYPFMGCWL